MPTTLQNAFPPVQRSSLVFIPSKRATTKAFASPCAMPSPWENYFNRKDILPYGQANTTPVFDVNQQGQLTSAADILINIEASQVSDFESAVEALLGAVTVYDGTAWTAANLAYTPGVFTYTTPTRAEVRNTISANGDINYDNVNGIISRLNQRFFCNDCILSIDKFTPSMALNPAYLDCNPSNSTLSSYQEDIAFVNEIIENFFPNKQALNIAASPSPITGKLNKVLAAIKPGSPNAAIIIASYSECISAIFSRTSVPVICASTFVEI